MEIQELFKQIVELDGDIRLMGDVRTEYRPSVHPWRINPKRIEVFIDDFVAKRKMLADELIILLKPVYEGKYFRTGSAKNGDKTDSYLANIVIMEIENEYKTAFSMDYFSTTIEDGKAYYSLITFGRETRVLPNPTCEITKEEYAAALVRFKENCTKQHFINP